MISQLKDQIKKLEITVDAHTDGGLLKNKEKQCLKQEKEIAKLEQKVEELEKSLEDVQMKYKSIGQEKAEIDEKVLHLKQELQETREELEETKRKLETKEKLQGEFKQKIAQLLGENQELLDKLENTEKETQEVLEKAEESKGQSSKKDRFYTKMIRTRDHEIEKLSEALNTTKTENNSKAQTISYLKSRQEDVEKELAESRNEIATLHQEVKQLKISQIDPIQDEGQST